MTSGLADPTELDHPVVGEIRLDSDTLGNDVDPDQALERPAPWPGCPQSPSRTAAPEEAIPSNRVDR